MFLDQWYGRGVYFGAFVFQWVGATRASGPPLSLVAIGLSCSLDLSTVISSGMVSSMPGAKQIATRGFASEVESHSFERWGTLLTVALIFGKTISMIPVETLNRGPIGQYENAASIFIFRTRTSAERVLGKRRHFSSEMVSAGRGSLTPNRRK